METVIPFFLTISSSVIFIFLLLFSFTYPSSSFLLSDKLCSSGSFYYRPSNFEICCPQIAIRISAAHFQPSRSHLRTLKRFRRFLSNDHCVDTDIEHYTLVEQSNNVQDNIPQTDNVKDDVRKSAELGIYSTDDQPSCPKDQRRPADINDSTGFSVIERYTSSLQQAVLKLSCNAFHGRVLVTRHRHRSDCLVSTIAQPLFGWLRSRKEQQHFSSFQSPRDVAERLQSLMNDDNVKVVGNGLLEIQLSQPLQESLNDQKGSLEDKHTKKNSSRPVAKKLRSDERDQQKRLVLHLQPSCFMKDEFELYSLYQSVVHGDTEDEITKDGYERFLCKSSLLPTYTPSKSNERIFQVAINGNTVEFQGNLLLPGYGSFHLRYEIIDSTGKTELMAVSILDILPTGLSSVYFTYNPSFSSLSPGTLSAFIELALMPRIQIPCISSSASLDVQAASDEFKYYYLGFYVHSCRKMRYKGQFNPSELLCPETLRWTLMDDRVRNVLDRERCARLALDGDVDGFNWCVRKITFQLQITIMFFSKLMKY